MKRYNIRVYALINHKGNLLVTDEFRNGIRMTKFPGGGHEWGEGLVDTVKRECVEELAQEPISTAHFYTTDFFIASAFHKEDQMISVYYKVVLPFPEEVKIAEQAFAFDEEVEGAQIFRWIPENEISPEHFTFAIDKKVAELLSRK